MKGYKVSIETKNGTIVSPVFDILPIPMQIEGRLSGQPAQIAVNTLLLICDDSRRLQWVPMEQCKVISWGDTI